jgi:hypothetical protein
MKNYTTQQLTATSILKIFGNAIKNFFTTGSNRDFERLKNYLSS